MRFLMYKLTVKEIHNREEAIKYGKNRGWCTGKINNHYYDSDYNPTIGRLFVIFKPPKQKPQYQIFLSHSGRVELRAKFNEFIDHTRFFNEEGINLKEWFEKTRKPVRIIDDKLARTATDIIIREPLNGHYSSDESLEYRRLRFDPRLIVEEADHFVGFGRPDANYRNRRFDLIQLQIIMENPEIINIHRLEELPHPRHVSDGAILVVEGIRERLIKLSNAIGNDYYFRLGYLGYHFPELQDYSFLEGTEAVSEIAMTNQTVIKLAVSEGFMRDVFERYIVVNQKYRTGEFEITVESEFKRMINR